MTPFELAKASVSVREAAEMYGLKIGRNKMANCPFHNDRSPSFYIQDDHFYCFGCGEHGDVIDLTAGLFGLSKIEAARKLLNDFGVDQCEIGAKTKAQRALTYEKVSAYAAEQRCVKALSEYRRLLRLWKKELAPKSPETPLDDRFVEACHNLEVTDYRLQLLDDAAEDERERIAKNFLSSKLIERIEQRLSDLKKEGQERAAS